MRRRAAMSPLDKAGALLRSVEDGRPVFWTRGLGVPPEVYGERVVYRDDVSLRRWDPARSKLAAALSKDYDGRLPSAGEFWLYLGAASGTTASHVADLVGPTGAVFAVEKSVRPFSRLLRLAERYPNLLPVLADARDPAAYLPLVPVVDGVYADVAQPDQVEIVTQNARWFLGQDGVALVALKTSSMGRDRSPQAHLKRSAEQLDEIGDVTGSWPLDPFHKRHYLISVSARGSRAERPAVRLSPRGGRRAGPSR